MNRFLVLVLLTAITALGTEVPAPAPPNQPSLPTFNKDVLPVLQKNCQVCHRAGGVAPMAFTTFESTRPWAKAIKAAVLSRKMPPWFADPHVGEFRNAPELTQADITTLTAWADNGAVEGNAADKPATLQWADGWRIQPDVVVSMPQPFRVSAKGEGEIQQFVITSPFKEDTWVSAIEIRPGNASVVHHAIFQVLDRKTGAPICNNCAESSVAGRASSTGTIFTTAAGVKLNSLPGSNYSNTDVLVRLRERETGRGSFTTMEAVYAPGTQPLDFRYRESAKLIPGGMPLQIEVHYTPNGTETTDQTKIAFTLAKEPTQRRFVMMAPEHLVDARMPIPAGASNWETKGELTFLQDAELVWFMPHMHLRGKDMTFRLIYPDGREEDVLSAKFNFNWQLGYEVKNPIKVIKNTRMIVTAHHDNSANNPMNPSPGSAAAWGEMTSQEMMLPWFGVVVDRDATPDTIAMYRPADLRLPPVVSKGGEEQFLRLLIETGQK
jgi:hypothetical protein